MEFLVSAHWTAYKGEFPHREVAGNGSIEFTLHGDICNLAGARMIAEANVADNKGFNYRDVTASIDTIVIRPEPQESASVTQPTTVVFKPALIPALETAGIGFAFLAVVLLCLKGAEKYIRRRNANKTKEK